MLKFDAAALEVARLVASVLGFHLDGQESLTGTKLSATNGTATINAHGTSLNDAAKSLINLLTE